MDSVDDLSCIAEAMQDRISALEDILSDLERVGLEDSDVYRAAEQELSDREALRDSFQLSVNRLVEKWVEEE